MISVAEALSLLFQLTPEMAEEQVPLSRAAGRVLTRPVVAQRNQPPFAAASMDGYALKGVEADPEAMFKVIGASRAGERFEGTVGPGQAVRIFTGAPVPVGADRVIMQEEVEVNGDLITLARHLSPAPHLRPMGSDFAIGAEIAAPRRLTPRDLALAAAMNAARLTVARAPDVAIIATGDELVMPGETPGPDQIIASNGFGLKAMFEAEGAAARLLPIAADNPDSLRTAFELAEGADLIVTIGGASVGDHDLVAPVAESLGMEMSFHKIAMRPGKPLMAGRIGQSMLIGLPGNPVSSMVCGHIFILPVLRAMQGLPAKPAPRETAILTTDLLANGPREHYMRATIREGEITPMPRQDSAFLSVLRDANALLVHPANSPAISAGQRVEYLEL
ncbi:MAG: molybdopterin molybdenumtransferase MoeA [Rhodobacterales bacterium]|nr:MAG: molybdopterin molybdenumtransferase MoeA [Rhodobacterales bacterium]